jgi:hypothetical protein
MELDAALKPLLQDSLQRTEMLHGYAQVQAKLGAPGAALNAARSMVQKIKLTLNA